MAEFPTHCLSGLGVGIGGIGGGIIGLSGLGGGSISGRGGGIGGLGSIVGGLSGIGGGLGGIGSSPGCSSIPTDDPAELTGHLLLKCQLGKPFDEFKDIMKNEKKDKLFKKSCFRHFLELSEDHTSHIQMSMVYDLINRRIKYMGDDKHSKEGKLAYPDAYDATDRIMDLNFYNNFKDRYHELSKLADTPGGPGFD
ncbi:hypothetical protein FXO37_02554 [Capsicum annuum]|nr:hypothetical protein FXO37_02554 [Capsicum annuum]